MKDLRSRPSSLQEDPDPGEVWHPSVQKFALRDAERTIGILYLDPFPRPGKKVQSAQFTLQGSKILADGQLQVPKTCLVYALPPGSQCLSTSFAVTFMHEIGHAVHSLLSETHFQHLSGTRGTIDFVVAWLQREVNMHFLLSWSRASFV